MSLEINDITLKNKRKYKRTQSFYFNSDPPSESKLINLKFFRDIYLNQLKKNNCTNEHNKEISKENNVIDNDCLKSFIQENNLSENIEKELEDNCCNVFNSLKYKEFIEQPKLLNELCKIIDKNNVKNTSNSNNNNESSNSTSNNKTSKKDNTGSKKSSTTEGPIEVILNEMKKSRLNTLSENNHLIVPLKKRKTLNYLEKIGIQKRNINTIENNAGQSPTEEVIKNTDIILNIEFYCQDDPSRVIDEFEVYGNQKLKDLRDAFFCSTEPIDFFSDSQVNRDFTKIPSSFFIENIFYNNYSDNIKDYYSSNIINWVYKKKRYLQPGLGRFISKSMDDVRFVDLSIRLNFPYLYIHHNNCKHIMIFTNVRLIHKTDDHHIRNYPKLVYKGWVRNYKCKLCSNKLAKWVTYDDLYATDNPCIWCQDCFDSFHKDKDGNFIYKDFKKLPLFIYPDYS
ncbi:hypothetical protein BCR36DRAFT_409909 [Piromyces finnis]|uniref:snRNA-activating protein complex subunit 3 n=1 Tax=Piromyces finnis TaxID=1754191 RepID=A0A1Y1VGK1_9FUNG|nr:hypothetical protein BCR36DRAFT_409909 [Piromyces finnis]|eukprot:ORX55855.1 hypothetical protein BCR36DRAFT_409909 [Piromyces finnis]